MTRFSSVLAGVVLSFLPGGSFAAIAAEVPAPPGTSAAIVVFDADGPSSPAVFVILGDRAYAGRLVSVVDGPAVPPLPPGEDPGPDAETARSGRLETAVRLAITLVPQADRDLRFDLGATFRTAGRWAETGMYPDPGASLDTIASYVRATLGDRKDAWQQAREAITEAIRVEILTRNSRPTPAEFGVILRRVGRTLETARP